MEKQAGRDSDLAQGAKSSAFPSLSRPLLVPTAISFLLSDSADLGSQEILRATCPELN
jgi:hypothetical protein